MTTETKCECPENYPQERVHDFGPYANFIARMNGIPEPTLRVRVHTGLCNLRDEPLAVTGWRKAKASS